jgi:VRR-NUC domain
VTEAELQAAVIELARVLRWRVAHFRPAKTERGWRTAVQGDGVGFPDLVLVRDGRLVFGELKSASGRVGPEQSVWLGELGVAGVEVYVWRPADWSSGAIEAVLR